MQLTFNLSAKFMVPDHRTMLAGQNGLLSRLMIPYVIKTLINSSNHILSNRLGLTPKNISDKRINFAANQPKMLRLLDTLRARGNVFQHLMQQNLFPIGAD